MKNGAKNEHAAKPGFHWKSRQNPTKWGQIVPLVIGSNLTEENFGFDHCINGGRLHALGEKLADGAKPKKPVSVEN